MENIKISLAKANTQFFGHEQAQTQMLEAFCAGNLPNAWLITGPKGIGKATLAYRFARFLLSHDMPVDQSDGLFGDTLDVSLPTSLDSNKEHPAVSRVLAGSHGDLLVIDTTENTEDKVKQEITVDEIRKVGKFLHLTPAESDWRIVIIDSADEMNRNAANAILKILEEPPKQALLLLVSHSPGKLLPTIRSRCRFLNLKPLDHEMVETIVKDTLPEASASQIEQLCYLAEGSPGLAMELYAGKGVELYQSLLGLFSAFPNLDVEAIHRLGDKLSSKKDIHVWVLTTYLLQLLIANIARADMVEQTEVVDGENTLKTALAKQCSPDQWVQVWEKIGQMIVEANQFNLDRKHSFITMMSTIKNAIT